jgi:hypothetical protein
LIESVFFVSFFGWYGYDDMMTDLGWRVVDDIGGVGRLDKMSMALLRHVYVME